MEYIVWLDRHTPLPDPALSDAEGLVAVGGELTVQRLQEAYSKGIFPWMTNGLDHLWWSPDPRMLLRCEDFHLSRTLRKKMRQIQRCENEARPPVIITANKAFAAVMEGCARGGGRHTWISPAIHKAYLGLHRAGMAHSVETWMDGELAGGLYGVSQGGFFFGESMFSHARDASKVALAHLVAFLRRCGVDWIDCQHETPHLTRMGARPMARREFMALLRASQGQPGAPWTRGRLLANGELLPEQGGTET